MRHREYNIEWSFLAIAIMVMITSIIGDCYNDKFNWFARSGSVIVLLAVIVEYRISSHIYEDIQRAQLIQSKVNMSVPMKGKPTNKRKKISIAAHITLILGTLIWGYGDLLWV